MFSRNYRKNKSFSPTGFRYRGVESSRLEHLTDAVFAFAITLLVIASEVPKTYVELQASMYGFLGFIACILLLLGIWSNHSMFFLRYGMQDAKTKTLNFLFLFVLLFYIYPLKYLFSYLGSLIVVNLIGSSGLSSEAFQLAIEKVRLAELTVDQWQDLMVRFGLGMFLIYTILGGMHLNAFLRKKQLELNEQEVYETKFHIFNFFMLMLISLTSIVYVLIRGGYYSGDAGLIYLLVPILLPVFKYIYNKRLKEKFPQLSQLKDEEDTLETKEVEKDEKKLKAVKTITKEKAISETKKVKSSKEQKSSSIKKPINKESNKLKK